MSGIKLIIKVRLIKKYDLSKLFLSFFKKIFKLINVNFKNIKAIIKNPKIPISDKI